MLEKIVKCFREEKYLYSQHAREEMEDKPYPSCLVYGKTSDERSLHIVCAYAEDVNKVIRITVYQPRWDQWIDFERRRK